MAAHMNGYAIPDYNPYTQFSDIQHFTFLDKYANYLPEEGRRETWLEAVTRSVDSLKMLSQEKLSEDIYQRIFDAIYRMDVLPSMRLFSMPRAAIERDNSVIYNCAFRGIDSTQAMAEMLYLGMSGCGTGFSVEKRFISQLPIVQWQTGRITTITIGDSQMSWARTYKVFLDDLYVGTDVIFDYSQIRPAGARLKTKGGYSSGAGVLKELHDHVRTIILGAQGRKLNSVEVLDIVNYITQAAISGGSRRAAQIALGDPDDNDFLTAKTNVGDKFWRYNSNNSAVWDDDTSDAVKEDLLHELYTSGAEPGILNRSAAVRNAPSRRKFDFAEFVGFNPCGEVNLASRPDGGEFCNLSTAIIKGTDSFAAIAQKVDIAAIIGTIQSMATNFPFLEKGWKINQEQDRLLGVCITGITDNAYLRKTSYLQSLKQVAVTTNVVIAKRLGIERSAAVTAVKPSGNTSALADTSPGVNPRHCAYAKRNILVNENTAMYEFLTANEVPFFDHPSRSSDKIFIFPYAAPEGVLLQKDFTAIQQCQLWETVKNSYVEHNVSVSIQYEPEEFPVLKDWILENADQINGMAFFKNQNTKFSYLPIQEVNKTEYDADYLFFPDLNWQNFGFYEQARDEKHEIAECSGGNCLVSF